MITTNEKILRLYIAKYHFATQEELHDKKTIKALKSIPEIQMTNLYAIVQTNKLYIDLDSICIHSTYELTCDLIINSNKKTIKFNLLQYYYAELKNNDELSFNQFVHNIEDFLLKIEPFKSNNEKKENLYKYITIRKELSHNSTIVIQCPFFWASCGRKNDFINLNLYRVINHFDLDILNELEIIYIGKSMTNTLNRLKEHNKWSAVLAKDQKNPEVNYDYLVYVFNFNKCETIILDINDQECSVVNYESTYNLKKLVDNIEVAFISHYKPLLNEKHINTIFDNTDFVKKELMEFGYTRLMLEMVINEDSSMGNIKTPKAKSQTVDINLSLSY